MKTPPLSLVAPIAVALMVAGCGDDQQATSRPADTQETSTGQAQQPSGKAATTVRLSATDFNFDPEDVEVQAGTIRFVTRNDGETVHALEVDGPRGEAETEEIRPGQSAELTVKLDQAGTYTMFCPVGNHREMGMEGKVSVAGGSGGGGGQSGPDQTETEEEPESGSSPGY